MKIPKIKGVTVYTDEFRKPYPDDVVVIQRNTFRTGKYSIHLTNRDYEQNLKRDTVLGVTASKSAAAEFAAQVRELNNIQESKSMNQKSKLNAYIRRRMNELLKEHGYSPMLRELDAVPPSTGEDLSKKTISDLARMVRRDWSKVNYAAEPYLDAMSSMTSASDRYGYDSGASVIRYFLGNATGWKGPVAKAVKLELNKRIKGIY